LSKSDFVVGTLVGWTIITLMKCDDVDAKSRIIFDDFDEV